MDKLKFCKDMVQTEQQKIHNYYLMLSKDYREFLPPSNDQTLTEIINAAWEREQELKRQVTLGERRESDPNPSSSKKQRTTDVPKKGNAKTGGSTNPCKTCGKKNLGECIYKNKPCPNCYKTGHVLTNCPSKLSVCFGCYQTGHRKADCPNASKPVVKTEPGK